MTAKWTTPNGSGHSFRDVGNECLNWWDRISNINSNFKFIFPGDRVTALMKNLANHWKYYSEVEFVYGLRYFTTFLIGTRQ